MQDLLTSWTAGAAYQAGTGTLAEADARSPPGLPGTDWYFDAMRAGGAEVPRGPERASRAGWTKARRLETPVLHQAGGTLMMGYPVCGDEGRGQFCSIAGASSTCRRALDPADRSRALVRKQQISATAPAFRASHAPCFGAAARAADADGSSFTEKERTRLAVGLESRDGRRGWGTGASDGCPATCPGRSSTPTSSSGT
jgi:hypothetical protein